jgi:hypothetical protein
MKQTTITIPSADDHEEWDRDDAADVYYPDTQQGENEITCMLRLAFEIHGYVVRDIREAPTHPVMIIHALRRNAPRMSDPRLFFRHIRGLLREAGIPLRRDELTANQTGDRIMIALLWKASPMNARPTGDELQAEYDPIP